MPKNLLPLQSGVGNIPNAVLDGLLKSDLENLTSYTEVIQDGMVDLIDAGKLTVASATAFSLSPEYAHKMNEARRSTASPSSCARRRSRTTRRSSAASAC